MGPPPRSRSDDAPPSSVTYEREYATKRRSGPLVAALLIGLLIVGGLVAFALLGGDGGGAGDQPKAGPTKEQSTSAPETTKQEPSSTPPSSTAESTPSSDGVPADYYRYEGPTGFSLAVPDGWDAVSSGPDQVDLKEPGGSRFIRLGWTSDPKKDPVKDWEEQEKRVAAENENYERISIEPVEYNGWKAADWEFTIGGVHVRDRGFVPAKDQGYAIYLSTSEGQWADSQDVWQTAVDSFQPAP